MEFKKFADFYIIRLDQNDQIIASLLAFAKKERVRLATIQGLGAVKDFTVGFFNPESRQYQEQKFQGFYEITTLLGNMTTKDGEPYLHVHATFGDENFQILGGHLKEATISVTGEVFIRIIKGEVDRTYQAIGINTIDFK